METWIKRAKCAFANIKGKRLHESEQLSIIHSKLSNQLFCQLSDAAVPKALTDLTLEQSFTLLLEHFGRKESMFMRRMKVWELTRTEDEDFDSLGARIKRAVSDFKLKNFSDEEFQNHLLIKAMRGPTDSNIQRKLLDKVQQHHAERTSAIDPEKHPPLQFATLLAMAKHHKMIDKDMQGSSISAPATIAATSAMTNTNRVTVPPKCHFCGDPHWHRDCTYKDASCAECKAKGHKKGFCESARTF